MSANSARALLEAVERGGLFPLLEQGPKVTASLCRGRRPHRTSVLRWSIRGLYGVRLKTVMVGRCRHTTKEWLVQFWHDVDEARTRRDKSRSGKRSRAASRPTKKVRTRARVGRRGGSRRA